MNQDTVVLVISIAVLVAFAAFWVRKRMKLNRARTWPVQAGKVDSTEVRLQSTGDMQSKFFAYVRYSYTVQGATQSGQMTRTFMRKKSADEWVGTYPSGLPISVRVNPEKVTDSVVFDAEQSGAKVARGQSA
jgi:hypothetical protein